MSVVYRDGAASARIALAYGGAALTLATALVGGMALLSMPTWASLLVATVGLAAAAICVVRSRQLRIELDDETLVIHNLFSISRVARHDFLAGRLVVLRTGPMPYPSLELAVPKPRWIRLMPVAPRDVDTLRARILGPPDGSEDDTQ